MANCINGVFKDLLNSCDDRTGLGIETTMYIMNRLDIESVSYNSTNNYIVDDIVLKTGKLAYKIEGTKTANSAGYSMVAKELTNDKYSHTISIIVSKQDSETMKQLDSVGDQVVIIETKAKGVDGVDGAIKILGLNYGLYQTEGSYNSNENEGLHLQTLTSKDGSEELTRPLSLWDTDYSTTKSKLAALLVA